MKSVQWFLSCTKIIQEVLFNFKLIYPNMSNIILLELRQWIVKEINLNKYRLGVKGKMSCKEKISISLTHSYTIKSFGWFDYKQVLANA